MIKVMSGGEGFEKVVCCGHELTEKDVMPILYAVEDVSEERYHLLSSWMKKNFTRIPVAFES